MIKRADWYLGRAAVLATIVVWVGLTTLFMLFSLLDELGPDESGIRLMELLWYVALTGPRSAYMVFPVSALLGALIGIGGLSATNELVAFRTAGMSRLRIVGSVLGSIGLLTIAVMAMGEWVAPAAEAQARAFKQSRATTTDTVEVDKGVWIRDANQFVHADKPLLSDDGDASSFSLHNVVIYSFDDTGQLNGITRARSARHEGDVWVLERSRHTAIGPDGVERDFRLERPWQSSVKPELLESVILRPRYMSISALNEQLDFLQRNGLDERVYHSAYWAKLLFPFTVLALVLAGMPFVFASARQHSIGLRIFIGMAVGSVFTIISRAAQNFGDAYDLPALVGTALPSLLLAVVVVAVLRRGV